ncbi:hypothetical protein EST38_g13617 [Candolleomyces aberdarensis]|uniref:Uncharacterized protein n=1 Tax=Candolleomyces aberdarensis TaxID=2316362 RepID=A0A4V1Q1N8_9AGAR|nr:hypothetical protein EST38_g13617 [Candolleomyces aberdarensis]
MLALTTACAGILIHAICRAPGLTLALTALVLLVHAKQEYNALATRMQETAAKYETTIDELREHVLTLEVELLSTSTRNRALTKENEECVNRSLIMQESINTLSEGFSKARETEAQHDATIADLKERNLGLESTIKDREEQISMAREALDEEVTQGRAAISSLQRERQERTKEAQDWKEYSKYREYPFSARPYLTKQQDASELSLTGIIAEKARKIEELRDRLIECYSQLTSMEAEMPLHTKL